MAYRSITVDGLTDDENGTANLLLKQIEDKTPRNLIRKNRYDAKHSVQQVAAILPPAYSRLASVLGWSAKAVDMLARRCNATTFTWTGGDIASLGLEEVWTANSLASEIGQGLTSSMLHASAFVATVVGEEGEPAAGVHFFDALDATGTWNMRARRLDSALIIDDRNGDGKQTAFTMHLPGEIVTVAKNGRWGVVDRATHDYGMTVDLLPYHPRTGRPFGSSRLTRPMMAISDMATRELLRLEGHMDVYSFPELWMLGADTSIFGDNADPMRIMLGRLKGIPDDNDAVNPRVQIQQIAASSPEPHLAALNAHAKLFARESGLPDSSLAITDMANPTSAESYDASQYDLIAEAEGATDDWTPPLSRVMARALAIQNGEPGLIPALERTIRPKWRNPKYVSRAAEADAGLKQIQAMPWLAETEVGMEIIGLTPDQMRRAKAERSRAQAQTRVSELLAGADATAI